MADWRRPHSIPTRLVSNFWVTGARVIAQSRLSFTAELHIGVRDLRHFGNDRLTLNYSFFGLGKPVARRDGVVMIFEFWGCSLTFSPRALSG